MLEGIKERLAALPTREWTIIDLAHLAVGDDVVIVVQTDGNMPALSAVEAFLANVVHDVELLVAAVDKSDEIAAAAKASSAQLLDETIKELDDTKRELDQVKLDAERAQVEAARQIGELAAIVRKQGEELEQKQQVLTLAAQPSPDPIKTYLPPGAVVSTQTTTTP